MKSYIAKVFYWTYGQNEWGQTVAIFQLKITFAFAKFLHYFLSPSDSGGIWTLKLRIISQLVYHCANNTGQDPGKATKGFIYFLYNKMSFMVQIKFITEDSIQLYYKY